MNILNRVIEYVKKNKLYVGAMIIGMILYAIQLKYVTLYADDLSLGIVANTKGFFGAFTYLADNYINWGGGPTPAIAIIFMLFDISVWKIFNLIIMALMIIISVKMINYHSKVNKGIIATIMWSMVFILDLWVARETIYWMDGHLAYVLTMFQLLLYIYYMHSKFIQKNEIKKYDYILLPLVAFFSGWTGPQVAVVTVLFGIIFIAWKKFIDKEKISKLLIITFLFSIIGFLVEVLAPGNSVRMSNSFPVFAQYTIVNKILYRIDCIYDLIFRPEGYGIGSLSFFSYITFGLISVISYQLADKEENKKLQKAVKVSSISIVIFIVFVILLKLNIITEEFGKFLYFRNLLEYGVTLKRLIPYTLATIVLITTCLLALYISVKRKNRILFITYFLGLMAQGVMVVSPYSPLRSLFYSIFLLWISIIYLIQVAYEEKISINYIIILIALIVEKGYAIAGIIILVVINTIAKEKKYKEILITICILAVCAVNKWVVLTKNYKLNQNVYNENISRIEKFVNENSKEQELKLLPPNDLKYGFDSFVGIDWIETATKLYFGIDRNVKLVEDVKK